MVKKLTDEFQEVVSSAIEKYTQDLTQLARENKLDPVIGREEELATSYANIISPNKE